MVKKWQTLIECHVDVKTTDGYTLRVFCIGFTSKDGSSHRKTCYAQTSQIKTIRKKMNDIIVRDVSSSDLKEVVNKLLPDSIAKDIEKSCHGVYPLHDVFIRKVRCDAGSSQFRLLTRIESFRWKCWRSRASTCPNCWNFMAMVASRPSQQQQPLQQLKAFPSSARKDMNRQSKLPSKIPQRFHPMDIASFL